MKCKCTKCKNDATWRLLVGGEIINICRGHHDVLMSKTDKTVNIETDKRVLNWILEQSSNPHKVMKYGIYLIGKRQVGSRVVDNDVREKIQ